MSVQYDATMRVGNDNAGLVKTLGAASLGGTIGVRVIVDDAIVTSKEQVMLAVDSIMTTFVLSGNWPAS